MHETKIKVDGIEYGVWHKDILAYIRRILKMPELANCWIWHPYQCFRIVQGRIIQEVHSPVEGDRYWKLQVR